MEGGLVEALGRGGGLYALRAADETVSTLLNVPTQARTVGAGVVSQSDGRMNILLVGSGAGSWQVRGHQLGAALGARVTSQPADDDLRWADVVVLIKRSVMVWAETVHHFGKPLVWDALDFWHQPGQNRLPDQDARQLLRAWMDRTRPTLVIGATQAMADAAGGVYLPHHARPGLQARPVKDAIDTVAYEGTRKYLGRWAQAIGSECRARGWQFLINPSDLSIADLVVAFRDREWDGGICREWKSGVKIVNAMAMGRPIITQRSAAFGELAPIGTAVETDDQLARAFDLYADRDQRASACAQSRADALALDRVAARYRLILRDVAARVAA